MSDKIVDIDPTKRMTKEALARIQKTVSEFKVDEVDNFVILYTKDGVTTFEAYGADWALMGISQAYLEELRSQLLYDSSEDEND